MFGLGPTEIIIIGILAVLLYGKDLPTVSRSLGKSFIEFKRGLDGVRSEFNSQISDITSTSPSNTSSSSKSKTSYHSDDEYDPPTSPKFEPPTSEPASAESVAEKSSAESSPTQTDSQIS
jgi:sec-independent protein translocase protein TatA